MCKRETCKALKVPALLGINLMASELGALVQTLGELFHQKKSAVAWPREKKKGRFVKREGDFFD